MGAMGLDPEASIILDAPSSSILGSRYEARNLNTVRRFVQTQAWIRVQPSLELPSAGVLVKSCQAWKTVQEEMADKINIIEHAWQRTRMQLEFIERLNLDEEYRRTLDELARTLAMRLSAAIAAINRAIQQESKKRPGFLGFGEGIKKSKYVLVKSAIDEAIQDVEDWQRRFDPSWFLIMRAAGPAINEELKSAKGREDREALTTRKSDMTGPTMPTQTPFRAAEGLRRVLQDSTATRVSVFLPNIALERQHIGCSSVQKAVFRGSGSSEDQRTFFVESITCPPGADLNALTADTRKLASRLTAADPLAFGLLSCKGVIKVPGDVRTGQAPSFTLVFRPPEGFSPEDGCSSLRELLLNLKSTRVSLSRRISIAQSLARSVSSVHTFEFVHKNIRPESVLLPSGDAQASTPFLMGFDSFREADGATSLLGDISWERNLYRHPTRHGKFVTERYRMHHDVYSLGVCLLELGLGESFVDYGQLGQPNRTAKLAYEFDIWLKKTGRKSQDSQGRLEELSVASPHTKDYLEHLAMTQVPHSAGTRYSQAVMACLSCLDDDKSQGLEEDDPYGIEVGMAFIQSVLCQLEEIRV